MNIKIVYNTKTHKISQKHQTLQDLRNAIQQLYPTQLNAGFDLYISLHPQYDPLKVLDEQHFNRIKEITKVMSQPSMKFLVKDYSNPQLCQEDFTLLNQSVVVKSTIDTAQIDQLYQQPQKDIPEIQETTQFKQQSTQGQQQHEFAQQIIQQIEQHPFHQIDYRSEEFQNYIINLIEERLQFHGLINQKQQENLKFSLVHKQYNQFTFVFGEQKNWTLSVKNEGNTIWKKGDIKLKGISGVFKNLEIDLQNDVQPNSIGIFQTQLESPNQVIQNQTCEFKMSCVRNNKQVQFGQKICFICSVSNLQQPIQQTSNIKQRDAEISNTLTGNQLRLKIFIEYTGASEAEAKQFMQLYDQKTDIQEIIGQYLDSIK